MLWKGLGLFFNTESPIVVVLRYASLLHPRCRLFDGFTSGSMEPAFHRGDLLFLTNPPNVQYQTGDITVYKVPNAEIPIVHRVLETHDIVVSNSTRKSKKDPFVLLFLLRCHACSPRLIGSRNMLQDPIS